MNDVALLKQLHLLSSAVAEQCVKSNVQLVLAESCTVGLVAASLGQIAGASQWLCGSAVVYQPATKQAWLAISKSVLDTYSAESLECSAALCRAALNATPVATCALAVTGRLGPSDRPEDDGVVFLACLRNDKVHEKRVELTPAHLDLACPMPTDFPELRIWRQQAAAYAALMLLRDTLSE